MGIDALLTGCLELDGDGRGRLTLAPALQGFPETAHGGGVLAAFDLAARRRLDHTMPRAISARIQKTIPLGVALPLNARPGDPGAVITLGDEAAPLARAVVTGPAPEPGAWGGWGGPPEKSQGFPTARGCLACGTENPVGLQVRLRFDDRWVWAEYRPREAYRAADGGVAPALYTVLLDEMAWWLGALATGEAGVTTDIQVTLHRPAHRFGDALLAVGSRESVVAADAKGHFWRTETAILAADGAPLAAGTITFAGSRAYSRRLIPKMLQWNPPESLRPIFPGHVP